MKRQGEERRERRKVRRKERKEIGGKTFGIFAF